MKFTITKFGSGKSGDIDLADEVFGIEEIRADFLHRMVRYQLAKRQAGTHKTQTRDEVSVTSKRFGRQKGSGGARHGSRNAPIFVGGSVAHGPRVRSHAHKLPKKVRALAMRHALSSKAKSGGLMVVESVAVTSPKTSGLSVQLQKAGLSNALVVSLERDANFELAARNIPNIDVLPLAGLNVYDILRRKTLVLTRDAIEGIHARYSGVGGV